MTVFVRYPVDNPVISQQFGAKNDWEDPPWHKGIDIAADEGTPIYAPCDGFIVWASGQPFGYGNTWEMIPGNGNSGNCVILQPPTPHTSLQTSFSHMSGITVTAGQWVHAGDLLGYVGNTGFSMGDHLHWEAFIDYAEGVYPAGTFYGRVNPLDYFNTATVVPLGTGGKGSTTPSEEDELNTDQNAALAQAWLNSKTALDRINRVIQVVESIEGVVKGNTGNVKKAADAILGATDESPYVKSEGNPDVYAYNVATGTIRLVTKSEWDIARSLGFTPKVVPQSTIDNAPKEETK